MSNHDQQDPKLNTSYEKPIETYISDIKLSPRVKHNSDARYNDLNQ